MEKKYLAVTHAANFMYGAGRSFCATVNNMGKPFDLLIPKPVYGEIDEEKIRKYFNDNLKKIFVLPLPYKRCFYGKESIRLKGHIYITLKNLIYYTNKRKIKELIKREEYDFIYLNSLVLYPLVQLAPNKSIIHIREKLESKLEKHIAKSVNHAKTVIFISDDTREKMESVGVYGHQINNPFDMRSVNDVDKNFIKNKFGIDDEIVFAIIGQAVKARGVDFVAESFDELNIKNIKLLIVGTTNTDCGAKLKEIAKQNKNIILTGEITEIETIYAISDYIIRAEQEFAVGRTVYEGLYAGCSVIIQGEYSKDIKKITDYELFQDRIFFYKPRNKESFFELISMLSERHTNVSKKGISNINQYITEFKNAIGEQYGK